MKLTSLLQFVAKIDKIDHACFILSSDTNDNCCSNCQYDNNTTQCAQAQPLLCKKAAYCTGLSKECPEPPNADVGTECIERYT